MRAGRYLLRGLVIGFELVLAVVEEGPSNTLLLESDGNGRAGVRLIG
jgi:hypothetical protein